MLRFIFLLFIISWGGHCFSQNKQQSVHKGKLFIIGGGEISDAFRAALLQAANWKKGDVIAAVTLASGYGDSAYSWINDDFKRLTGEDCLKFDSAAAHDSQKIAALQKAAIIFLGGGDQERFMRIIKNTPVRDAIRAARKNGAMVAGTSAGAAVMSKRMITGNALLDTVQGATFKRLSKGNLEIAEGLGMLDSVIIDQHFITRSRYNRLLTAIMENPAFDCVGIDESTAIIVEGGWATVAGERQVIVLSHPRNVHTGANHTLAAAAVQIAVYIAGEKFKIKEAE